MAEREKQELEITERVFDAVLDGVRTGRLKNPAPAVNELAEAAIHLLLGTKEHQ